MNQYHKDDSINEMLSMLDNAHDIFVRRYGENHPTTGSRLQEIYRKIEQIVKEDDLPQGEMAQVRRWLHKDDIPVVIEKLEYKEDNSE